MPKLGNAEQLEKIILPSTATLPAEDQAWVVIDISPNKAGDYYNINEMVAGHITFAVLTERIREWNYQDAEGELLPITLDNLKRLDANDFAFLQGKIKNGNENKMDEAQKKTSSDTSSSVVNVQVDQA